MFTYIASRALDLYAYVTDIMEPYSSPYKSIKVIKNKTAYDITFVCNLLYYFTNVCGSHKIMSWCPPLAIPLKIGYHHDDKDTIMVKNTNIVKLLFKEYNNMNEMARFKFLVGYSLFAKEELKTNIIINLRNFDADCTISDALAFYNILHDGTLTIKNKSDTITTFNDIDVVLMKQLHPYL
jgi:hypothetical protein